MKTICAKRLGFLGGLLMFAFAFTSCATNEEVACELVTQLLTQNGETATCKIVELGMESPQGQFKNAKALLSDDSEFPITVSIENDSIFVIPPRNFIVRKSTLLFHQNLTIEKAFENAFGEVKWSDKIAPNGVKYVEMEGIVDDWFIKQLYNLDPGGNIELYVGLQALQLGLYAMVGARTEAEQAAKELNDLLCKGTESDILVREKYWQNKLNGPDSIFEKKRMAKLPSPGSKFIAQFQFAADGENFELSYWGLDSLAGNCKLDKIAKSTEETLELEDFLNWVYSDHVYKPTEYKIPPVCNVEKEGVEFDGLKCVNGKYDLICNDSLEGVYMKIENKNDKKLWGDARVCEKGNWRKATEQELKVKAACIAKNENQIIDATYNYRNVSMQCKEGQWIFVCDEKNEGLRHEDQICRNGQWIKE